MDIQEITFTVEDKKSVRKHHDNTGEGFFVTCATCGSHNTSVIAPRQHDSVSIPDVRFACHDCGVRIFFVSDGYI